jgi:HSP20 family protein
MDDLFDRFLGDMRQCGPADWFGGPGAFGFALDVAESDKAITVKADLPGIDLKDLDINVVGDTLTICGQKKEEHETEGKHWHRLERRSGTFQRSIRLPGGVDPDKVEARYKDGVLEINLPRTEESRPRRITVNQ